MDGNIRTLENKKAAQFDLSAIRFLIIPGKLGAHASTKSVHIYNNIYRFWKSYWTGIMEGLASKIPSTEEFFRQDNILVLIDSNQPENENVVAFIFLNQFNIKTTISEHPYLSQYSDEFFGELRNKEISSVWSGQFITVVDRYSAKNTRMNFPAVILGLMHEFYRSRAHDTSALISLARTDIASANTAKKFGWEVVGNGIEMHGVSVDQIAYFGKPPAHKDERVNELVKKFWSERIDYGSIEADERLKLVG
jgi:hypothetical protein